MGGAMAHITVSPQTIRMVEASVPYGNQTAFDQFLTAAKARFDRAEALLRGRVVHIVSSRSEAALGVRLQALGAEVRKSPTLAHVLANLAAAEQVDILLLCGVAARHADVDALDALQLWAPRLSVVVPEGCAPQLVAAGLARPVSLSLMARKQMRADLDAAVVEGRMREEAARASAPIVPVFRRPAQRRTRLFGQAALARAA